MRFCVLGPLEVRASDGQLVQLHAPKHRTLLAMLLLHANQPVSVDRLTQALWPGPEGPPRSAAGVVRTYVSALRQALRLDGSLRRVRLAAEAAAYRLELAPAELDLLVFEELAAGGRRALAGGDEAGAAERLRQALSLWRGRPFEDVPLDGTVETELAQLQEHRLAAQEALAEARLSLGQHAEVAAGLGALVAEQPLREGLWGQWMLALYRAGRQAEALAAYRRLREHLVTELGIEPSPALQRLHRQILAADPALDSPVRPGTRAANGAAAGVEPPPCQLPPDICSFTGRAGELAALHRMLEERDGQSPVVIAAIDGAGGIGKSALAVRAGHQLAERFPHGQLYVDLRGATVGIQPVEPIAALGRFLRALGVPPADIPTTVEEATASFRTLAASRRLLVMLDNAADAAQVRPLLPGSPTCAVLVTSRQVLATLDGARHLHLDVLPASEAVALLERLAGPERVAAEPEAAERIAHLCGWLPLALRIAGARLAARPSWPVGALAERLAHAQRRLDELQLRDLGVRASFRASYDALRDAGDPTDRQAAEAFALLGLLDGPELSVPVAARLLDQTEPVAERVLERLADSRLLDSPAPGRYRLHDLLRLFARELAAERHSDAERAAALTRALTWYVATTLQTDRLLRPGDPRLADAARALQAQGQRFATVPEALRWLEQERANLVAATHQAAATPGVPSDIAIKLAQALIGFFIVRGYWLDWVQVNQMALALARTVGDRAAMAQAYRDLGVAHEMRGQYEQAQSFLRRGLTIFRALDNRSGQAAILTSLGIIHHRRGKYAEATKCYQESLAIHQATGNRHGTAIDLNNLGMAYWRQQDHANAMACYAEGLSLFRQLNEQRGQAAILTNLGEIHAVEGRLAEAVACHQESLAITRTVGDRQAEAHALDNLGTVHLRLQDATSALAYHQQSLVLNRQLGDRRGEADGLRGLGNALHALGRSQEARTNWREALDIIEQLGLPEADQVRARLEEAATPC